MKNLKKIFVTLLSVWLAVSFITVWFITRPNRAVHATVDMGAGLIILWVAVCGSLMYRFRDKIRNFVLGISIDWKLKFVLFSTILVLIEEAVTTTMTNLAPLFGAKIGEAYATASTNYFDVIFFHSVIVIFPMFIAWALFLWRYKFSPFEVFFLFGITGIIMEGSFGGAWGAFAMFFFVYGLIVYLPAYCCVPEKRQAAVPKWWLYPLAIFIPLLFIPLTAWIPKLVSPNHPRIDFIKY